LELCGYDQLLFAQVVVGIHLCVKRTHSRTIHRSIHPERRGRQHTLREKDCGNDGFISHLSEIHFLINPKSGSAPLM